MTFFVSLYMTMDAPLIQTYFQSLFPSSYRSELSDLLRRIGLVWQSFLRGQLILSIVVGTVTWLALTALTVVIEFIVLNLAWFGLLFFVGREATAVGMAVSFVIFAATPLAWALVLRRRAHNAAAQSAAAGNGAAAHG